MVYIQALFPFKPFTYTPVTEPVFVRLLAFGNHTYKFIIRIALLQTVSVIIITLTRYIVKVTHLAYRILSCKSLYDRENLRCPHFPSVSIIKFRSSSTSISSRAILASGVFVLRGLITRTVCFFIGSFESGVSPRVGISLAIRYRRHQLFIVSNGTMLQSTKEQTIGKHTATAVGKDCCRPE